MLQAARDPDDARERYVFVDDEGNARELYERECEYLATAFDGADGDRPYIKARYDSLTPDGFVRGFLERRHLPRRAKVEPRPDPARYNRPRRFRRAGTTVRNVVASLVVAAMCGYVAVIASAFVALQFMRPGYRGLGIALFVLTAFAGLPYYLIAGPLNALLTADPYRFLRFLCVTGSWLGVLGGAAWVLWFHGDPSRIILFSRIS